MAKARQETGGNGKLLEERVRATIGILSRDPVFQEITTKELPKRDFRVVQTADLEGLSATLADIYLLDVSGWNPDEMGDYATLVGLIDSIKSKYHKSNILVFATKSQHRSAAFESVRKAFRNCVIDEIYLRPDNQIPIRGTTLSIQQQTANYRLELVSFIGTEVIDALNKYAPRQPIANITILPKGPHGDKSEITEYETIGIKGATRLGKSSTMDILEEKYPDKYERGGKHKYRFVGGKWQTDNQKKDGQSIETWEEAEARAADKTKTAFDYFSRDTWHLVDAEDAQRRDKHMVYIFDVVSGARKFVQHFKGRNISYLLWTSPELIESRLTEARSFAHIPDKQIKIRLDQYGEEHAAFKETAGMYHFPMFIKSPTVDRDIVLPEELREKERREVEANVSRLVSLVDEYRKHYKKGMNVQELHEAYCDYVVSSLVKSSLSNLAFRINNWKEIPASDEKFRKESEVKIVLGDLEDESKELSGKELLIYRNLKDIPTSIQHLVRSTKVMDYASDNARYIIALEGVVEPDSSRITRLENSPEDVILDSIALRLGQPTQRRLVMNEKFGQESYFGLAAVEGGLVRDGALYSLGDPILAVHKHPSVAIVFLYSKGKDAKDVKICGLSSKRVQELPLYRLDSTPL